MKISQIDWVADPYFSMLPIKHKKNDDKEAEPSLCTYVQLFWLKCTKGDPESMPPKKCANYLYWFCYSHWEKKPESEIYNKFENLWEGGGLMSI